MSEKENKPKKGQRIKLRLYKHPVKLDADVLEFAPDGKWIVVRFDGPLPDTKLWLWRETMLTDKEPEKFSDSHDSLAQGAHLWEVL